MGATDMPRLPRITAEELLRALYQDGWYKMVEDAGLAIDELERLLLGATRSC